MKKSIVILILLVFPIFVYAQNIVSVSPSSANAGQTLNVTITGNNTQFTQGSGTTVFFTFSQGSGATIVVNSINIISNTSIQANITVPSNAYTGYYHVSVYGIYPGVPALYNGFYVYGITPPPPPYLVSINPNNGNAGQTLSVTITGANTHFSQGSGTYVDLYFNQASGTSVNFINIISDSSLSANITVPPTTYTGFYTVSVYSLIDDYISLINGFYVNGIPPPALVSINPNNAMAGQTLNVTITGANTHFSQGSGTYISFNFNMASGTTVVNYLNILNDTGIQANITVPSGTYNGLYDVSVYNSIDGYLTLTNGFIVGNTGIEENENSNHVIIYPNPSKGNIFIDNTFSGNNTGFMILIYNMQGILLLQQPSAFKKTEINISKLVRGAYILTIGTGNSFIYKKILKE